MTLRRDDPERDTRPRASFGRFWRGVGFFMREYIEPRGWVGLVGILALTVWLVVDAIVRSSSMH